MIVSRSCTMHPQSPPLTIGWTVLKEPDDLVILGVIFHSKMTVEVHVWPLKQGITKNHWKRLWCTYRLSKNSSGTKSCLSIWRKAVEFDPDEYQKFKYHRYVQKSYVPTSLRALITTLEQTQTFILKNVYLFIIIIFFLPSSVPSHNLLWQTL